MNSPLGRPLRHTGLHHHKTSTRNCQLTHAHSPAICKSPGPPTTTSSAQHEKQTTQCGSKVREAATRLNSNCGQIISAEAAFAPHTLPKPASVFTCSSPTLERPPAASTKRTSAPHWAPANKANAKSKSNTTRAMIQGRFLHPQGRCESTRTGQARRARSTSTTTKPKNCFDAAPASMPSLTIAPTHMHSQPHFLERAPRKAIGRHTS